MMKTYRHIFLNAAFLLSALLTLTSCGEKVVDNRLDISGTWELINLTETRSVSLGSENVEVYITFTADVADATRAGKVTLTESAGTFSLYQMLGTGQFRTFEGKWNLDGTSLTGTYADGTKWGADYEVSLDDNNTRLTLSAPLETCVYTKTTLPADLVH